MQLTCWLRFPKLILLHTVSKFLKETSGPANASEKTVIQRILDMILLVLSVIHLGACAWFYIGSRYQVIEKIFGIRKNFHKTARHLLWT